VSGYEGRDPVEDFKLINSELHKFSPMLAKRPQIAVANKSDIATEEQIKKFKKFCDSIDVPFFAISAATKSGVDNLVKNVYAELQKLPPTATFEPENPIKSKEETLKNDFKIIKTEDGVYEITADWLAAIIDNANLDDYSSLQYFQRRLQNSGIVNELENMGVKNGDTIRIGDYEFDYVR
jgi:GTP-binding protein